MGGTILPMVNKYASLKKRKLITPIVMRIMLRHPKLLLGGQLAAFVKQPKMTPKTSPKTSVKPF
jgi:hypothetical protein